MIKTGKSSTVWRISKSLLASVCSLVLVLAPIDLLAADGGDEWRRSGVERVVAISDVHGAYGAMVNTLRNAGVLDESLSWSAGETHLVITGDLLDRGPDSRQVMDLLMRIEPEAADAGGEVHLLLGNHEVMNLVGDLRYVTKQEYAAFAADESAEERERWFRRYYDDKLVVTDVEALRVEFNDKRPPGFFAHRRAFRSDGKYGHWLLTKPLIAVINDTAYVHGGLAPDIADIGLEGVNGKIKSELVTYVRQLDVLYDAGLLAPAINFYDHAEALGALSTATDRHADVAAAIKTVIALSDAAIHDSDSPLWYRGNVGCGPLVEIDRIEPALSAIGASRVVIGHTPTQSRRVLSRLNGRITEIDTGMNNGYYNGSGNALVIEGDVMTVLNEHSPDKLDVTPHPRRVGYRKGDISADDLRNILSNGDLVSRQMTGDGNTNVKVSLDGVAIDAVFSPLPRSRGFVPELAAFRLDLLLGLEMVPVTVRRQIDGKDGTLQFKPKSLVTEGQRSAARRGGSGWCPLPDQWNAMYIFDVLIFNPLRAQQFMLYSPDNWQLVLTGHNKSFDTGRSRPRYLKDVALEIGVGWREKLAALTDDVLNDALADLMNSRRIKALARRRDLLLEDATK